MKQISLFSLLLLLVCNSANALTRTSIANGNWNNPAIWSPAGVPQFSDDILVINTQVSLTQNVLHGTVDFRINAGASLISTGQDTLTLGCNLAHIDGYLQVNVLICTLTDSIINTGIIVAGELVQSGTFINRASGQICLFIGLFTSDDFINNGSVNSDNWVNSALTSGNGRYCIGSSFVNSGSINGTADICDATPNGISDLNIGTIATTITNCQVGPCAVCTQPNAIAEIPRSNNTPSASPNPMNDRTMITITGIIESGSQLQLLSVQGKLIRSITLTGNTVELERDGLEAGIYLYRVVSNNASSQAGKLIVQ